MPNQSFQAALEGEREGWVCARLHADENNHTREEPSGYGIRPRNDEQMMALDALLNRKIDSFPYRRRRNRKDPLALPAALEQEKEYRAVISPVDVVLGNQDRGFSRGPEAEMTPFLSPEDNLNVIKSRSARLQESAAHREYAQSGETHHGSGIHQGQEPRKCYFIIDESQNPPQE